MNPYGQGIQGFLENVDSFPYKVVSTYRNVSRFFFG